MDPAIVGAAVMAAMIILLLLRIPIAVSLICAGFGGLVLVLTARGGGDLDAFGRALSAANHFLGDLAYSSVAEYTYTTIPMFLLMGYLATEGGFTRDIYAAARMWFARVPGGLAVASAVGCTLFSAISGSSLATAAAMGRMAIPEMLHWKYDKGLASGIVAASGTLGSLIPPSILMILYAVFTEQSVAKLFVAGVLPGMLSLGAYVLIVMIRVKINPQLAPPVPAVPMRDKIGSLRGIWGMLALIALVVTGLYTGMFTPSEAGGIGAMVALLLCLFSGRIKFKGVAAAGEETLKTTSMLFAAVLGAYMVTTFSALTGFAGELTSWASSFENVPPIVILAVLSVLYIVLGTFMGAIEIMLLTLPVVIPVIKGLGYDLIWFGIIMIKYLEIGLITPPVGLNVFIIKAVTGDLIGMGQIFKGVAWFILMDIVVLAILILWPDITLWLPSLM
ncbi:TRAP transporter large permease [Alloalcanivorax xenomutans]|uniref:TRAP transporter large permease n=2 Tax=Alloalcanivorax xenomutans TaxID=1094342 RepID=UPI0029313ECE|nr:TRAP transporter large permease [Alloalcanivorax xenomutans]WOA32177.1 TRAP transporter large permease [Alloalcanivorax xenomutans]WOD29141.1 TRAP transporter large permease [Alloalcanivorax xenomutans]